MSPQLPRVEVNEEHILKGLLYRLVIGAALYTQMLLKGVANTLLLLTGPINHTYPL